MFGARFSKEVVGLGLALGLALAIAEPIGRLLINPTPWAPSSGADRAAARAPDARYNLHVVPYGIDRGLCDRGRIAADLKSGSRARADNMLVGSSVGAKMDVVDQSCVSNALEFAPDQRRVLWRNPDNGVSYTLVATQTFQNDRGVYCREYDTTAVLGGLLQQVHGTACRQASGTWTATR